MEGTFASQSSKQVLRDTRAKCMLQLRLSDRVDNSPQKLNNEREEMVHDRIVEEPMGVGAGDGLDITKLLGHDVL